MTSIRGTGTLATAIIGINGGGNPGNIAQASSIFLSFGITIFFLIMSLKIATSFGIAGAEKTIAFGNTLRGKAQSAIGRNTIGRGSEILLKKYDKLNASAQNSKSGRVAGRVLKYGTLGILGDRSVRGALEAGKKAKYGGDYSRADDKAYDEEHKKRQANTNEQAKLQQAITAGLNNATGDPAVQIAMEKAVAGASVKFLEELDQKEREKIIDYMTQSQFEGLQKSSELSETDKAQLGAARASAIQGRLISAENRKRAAAAPAGGPAPAPATLTDVIGKASGKELDTLDYNDVLNNAKQLSSKQIDDMSLTQTAKDRLKGKRESDLVAEFGTMGGPVAIFRRFNDTEAAKLPKGILTNVTAAPFINVNTLNKIVDNDSITAADRSTIKANVIAHHSRLPSAATFTNFFNSPLGQRYT